MSFPLSVHLTEAETLQESANKEHRLGTRGETEDGRVYYYCRANGTSGVARAYLGCQSNYTYKADGSEDCWQGTLSAAAAAGDFTLTTLDTTAGHTADFFEDGYVYLRPTSAAQQLYRVKSNTAAGTSTTLTLYTALKYDCATAGTIVIYPNPYADIIRVHGGGDTKAPHMCVANFAPITASYYFWGQTWGPCMLTPSEAFPSGTYNDRVVFSYDGSCKLEPASAASNYNQRAGWSLMNYTDDQTNALLFTMLEIRP